MKGGTQPRGAGPATTEISLNEKPVIGRGKNFAKKKREILRNFTEADVDAEVRALEALLKEEGLIGVPERELAREAAFEDLVREELCEEQIGKLARESARKTGDTIGEVVDRYERIVIELRCVRERSDGGGRQSLESVLRGAADDEL